MLLWLGVKLGLCSRWSRTSHSCNVMLPYFFEHFHWFLYSEFYTPVKHFLLWSWCINSPSCWRCPWHAWMIRIFGFPINLVQSFISLSRSSTYTGMLFDPYTAPATPSVSQFSILVCETPPVKTLWRHLHITVQKAVVCLSVSCLVVLKKSHLKEEIFHQVQKYFSHLCTLQMKPILMHIKSNYTQVTRLKLPCFCNFSNYSIKTNVIHKYIYKLFLSLLSCSCDLQYLQYFSYYMICTTMHSINVTVTKATWDTLYLLNYKVRQTESKNLRRDKFWEEITLPLTEVKMSRTIRMHGGDEKCIQKVRKPEGTRSSKSSSHTLEDNIYVG